MGHWGHFEKVAKGLQRAGHDAAGVFKDEALKRRRPLPFWNKATENGLGWACSAEEF